jgi:hypothetical protein
MDEPSVGGLGFSAPAAEPPAPPPAPPPPPPAPAIDQPPINPDALLSALAIAEKLSKSLGGAPHPPAVSILPEAAAELGLKALEPPQPYVSAMSSEREVNRRKLALLKNWEFIVAKDQALLDDRARAALLEGLGAKKKARAKPQARGSGSGADAYNATKQGIGAEPEGKGRGREAGAKRKKSAPKEGGVQPSFAV